MTTDPTEQLADLAQRGVELANDPEKLRRRLAELDAEESAAARREVLAAIEENADALNDAIDRRDPKVMAKVKRALGGER